MKHIKNMKRKENTECLNMRYIFATGGVSDSPIINTSGIVLNVTITSSGGSVIIQLG